MTISARKNKQAQFQELPLSISIVRSFDKCSWLWVREHCASGAAAAFCQKCIIQFLFTPLFVHVFVHVRRARRKKKEEEATRVNVFLAVRSYWFSAKGGWRNPLIRLKLGRSRPLCYSVSLLIICCIIIPTCRMCALCVCVRTRLCMCVDKQSKG